MNSKITYTKVGDFYMPNLTLAKSKYKNYPLSKYGRMRLNYLKNYKKAEYIILFMDNKLDEHLYNIDTECQKQFANKDNITEKFKSTSQLEWVQKMNNIRNSVDEIIINTYIYV